MGAQDHRADEGAVVVRAGQHRGRRFEIRLDVDETYAEALGAVSGEKDLNDRPAVRTHIWHDPALASEG